MSAIDPSIAALFESSMDPFCLLDHEGRVIACNPMMRTFLGLKPRELAKKPIFCDLVKLAICKDGCQIKVAIDKAKSIRADEIPAKRGPGKYRVIIKGTPRVVDGKPGMLLTLRDTSAEVILQAKYHKVVHLLEEEQSKNADLRDRIKRVALTHVSK